MIKLIFEVIIWQEKKKFLRLEFAEKIKCFLQTLGNGFKRGCVLSRTRPRSHTPSVGFEKSQKIVIFWIFPHPP